jgi:hypothetical protein
MHSDDATPRQNAVHHEQSDVSFGAVLKFVVALTVVGAVVHLMVWLLMGSFESQAAKEQVQYPLAVGQEERLPPGPRLQVEPRQDFSSYEAHQRELLNGYSWVDRATGVVRIPIDQAKKLILDRGLPSRPAQEGGQKP